MFSLDFLVLPAKEIQLVSFCVGSDSMPQQFVQRQQLYNHAHYNTSK